MLLAVNYHYVGMPEFPCAGIYNLEKFQFLNQVRWLKERFRLVSLPEILDWVQFGSWPDEAVCLITFDDGLRCHHEVVVPLMREHGIPAAFFVSGRPLAERRGTEIHKSHVVRARLGDALVREAFIAFLKRKAMDEELFSAIPEAEIRAHYRYDPFPTAQFKYWTNYVLPPDLRGEFWDDLILELYEKESDFCEEWYMDESMIAAMHKEFECIGSHAWSHDPLASMTEAEATRELVHSRKVLEDCTRGAILALSYPLGNANAVGQREGALALEVGYRLGFTMERAINMTGRYPTLMARIDCNDLPEVGKLPLFEWTNAGLHRPDGLPVKRRCETQALA